MSREFSIKQKMDGTNEGWIYERNPQGGSSGLEVVDKDSYVNLKTAFEYLVAQLPEECTAGFVTHARAIASGDKAEIERTS
jgi:hypothetical protein